MWVCFFAVALAPIPAGTPLGQLFLLLGAFAPSLAALLVTAGAEGKPGVSALLRGVINWRVAARWYVFAVSFTVIVKLTVAIIYRVVLGAWPRFGTDPWYMIQLAIAFSTPFQAGEEIGWRGYALPRLAERFGAVAGDRRARNHLGLLAPASILHSGGGHVPAVLLGVRHWRDGIIGNSCLALAAHRWKPAAHHAVAFRLE